MFVVENGQMLQTCRRRVSPPGTAVSSAETAVSSVGTAVSSRCCRQRSHTLHATLDGALFSVIDLLQPRLTCVRPLAVTHARLREEIGGVGVLALGNVRAHAPPVFPIQFTRLAVARGAGSVRVSGPLRRV